MSTTGLSGTAGLDGGEMAETAGTSNCGVRSATACRDGVGGDAGRVTGRSGAGAGALATSPFDAGDCCFGGEGSGVVARISRLVTVWGSTDRTVVLTSRSGSADAAGVFETGARSGSVIAARSVWLRSSRSIAAVGVSARLGAGIQSPP